MDDPTLVNFPLPMLTALLCGLLAGLVWRLELGIARASGVFSALFALCALQALLVGLRFGYDVTGLIQLQRSLPVFLGQLMYLSFAAMTVCTRDFARLVVVHIGVPVTVLAMLWLFVGDLRHLDWVIGLSYLYYLVRLYLLWRKGPDALIYARVDISGNLSNWIFRGMGLLVFILVLDTMIALDFFFNRGANASALISFGTLPLIATLFALLLTIPAMIARPRNVAPAGQIQAEDDTGVEARLRALMETEQVFLDPDLTVQRLARRLHLPARDVSGAVNRTQAMNVSQYVNGFRLAHAAALLMDGGESVAKIAEQSGFMTRSNFYREFQRVYGMSPTEYRATGRRTKGEVR